MWADVPYDNAVESLDNYREQRKNDPAIAGMLSYCKAKDRHGGTKPKECKESGATHQVQSSLQRCPL